MFSVPNILTLSRIGLIPVMMIFLYIPFGWAAWLALFIYVVIALTDYLDGYLARKMNQISAFGTFLDPIADKILIAAALLVLIDIERIGGLMIIPAFLILTREFLVSGLREFLGPRDVKIPVTFIAKCKTTLQMMAIGFLIIGPFMPPFDTIGIILLLVAMAVTVKTGYDYFVAAWPELIK